MGYLNFSVLGGVRHNSPLGPNQFRRYASTLISSTVVSGNRDTASKVTIFKIGAAAPVDMSVEGSHSLVEDQIATMMAENPQAYVGSKKRNELRKRLTAAEKLRREADGSVSKSHPLNASLRVIPHSVMAIQQTYRVSGGSSSELVSFSRRYTDVGGDFSVADHSALVERLAMGLAFYSLHGSLSFADFTARQPVNVTPVTMLDSPLAASNTCVWLPRAVDTVMSPNIQSAVIGACAAVGSTPVTDMVALDDQRCATFNEAHDADLVAGIIGALKLIGSNYAHSDAGSLYAYAFTRGIHRVLSVVGMTDEGALMRDVLRSKNFVPSYGGINPHLHSWAGLAPPHDLTQAGIAAMVDGIALTTAAGVSVSDPGVHIDGRFYPTVCVRSSSKVVKSGVNVDVGEGDKPRLAASIHAASAPFIRNYVTFLTAAFGFKTGGADGTVEDHLLTCFERDVLCSSRHLDYSSVAPFYWIEPTGVLHKDLAQTTATQNGMGPLCYPDEDTEMPLCPGLTGLLDEGNVSEVTVDWRSARTSGLALHFGNHSLDGLANSRIVAAEPNSWIHLGGSSEDMESRMENGNDLASYLWSRADVAIPAPSESMYVGSKITLFNRHASVDENTWKSVITHFPLPSELSGSVTLSVSRLVPHSVGPLGPDRHAIRAFNHATRSLENARLTGAFSRSRRAGAVRFVDPMPALPEPRLALPGTAGEVNPGVPLNRQAPSPNASTSLPTQVERVSSAQEVAPITVPAPARGPVAPKPLVGLSTQAVPSAPLVAQPETRAEGGVQ